MHRIARTARADYDMIYRGVLLCEMLGVCVSLPVHPTARLSIRPVNRLPTNTYVRSPARGPVRPPDNPLAARTPARACVYACA